MKRLLLSAWFISVLMLTPAPVHAQDVIRHPEPEQPLEPKWTWALEQAARPAFRDGYWVGYAIERRMEEGVSIGSWSSTQRHPTLHELLFGKVLPPWSGDGASERMVTKEVALLFRMVPGGDRPVEVDVTTFNGEVDLKGRPLLWLGAASDAASLDHVQALHARAGTAKTQEGLVMAMAMHEDDRRVVAELAAVLTGTAADEVREDAAFWLGQRHHTDALALLVGTARTDRSEDVREQAVFAVSQTDLPAATEALIDLARNGDSEVREKAIFWLSQEASERAVEALGAIAQDDPDTDVQKQAVFALSQLSPDESVPLLVEIARTHANPVVRKEAIFWLGQSEDPRALAAIIELVRG